MFRIKICGVTRAEDVESVVDAGADALGLNFYPQSRRYLKPEPSDAFLAALRAAQSAGCQVVGVFVNENPSEILRRRSQYLLDWVQLHGNEPIDFARRLPGARILRAMGYGEAGLSTVVGQLNAMEAAGCGPEAVLLDAPDPVQFGGTGRELPWSRLQSELNEGRRLSVPWVLAGGLKASNVREAIRAVNPNGVDVASGVESSAGIKDHEKIRAFVREARAGWAEVDDRGTVRWET